MTPIGPHDVVSFKNEVLDTVSTPERHDRQQTFDPENDFRRIASNGSDVISSNGFSGPQEAKAAMVLLTPKALTSFSGRKQEEGVMS